MEIASLAVTTFPEPREKSPAVTGDVARAAAGDRRAFERLYREQLARIHSLVRRMVGTDEAEETTQDVFVRAWQKLGTFRGESAFPTWLHRVAVNVILDRRQRLGIRRSRFVDSEDAIAQLPARPRTGDFAMDLDAAIELLPDGARQVFVLHDVEGYRHEEIAELLGVAVGTTKSQLHRARGLLRDHLEG